MPSVNSSFITQANYDPPTKVFTLNFATGSVQAYKNVPPDVVKGFFASGSHGKYFHEQIKNAGYESLKLK